MGQADAVDIGADYVARFIYRGIVHGPNLLHIGIHNGADAQQQRDRDDGQNARDRHMDDLAHAARAVHDSGLVERWINGRNGGQEDDRAVACLLPYGAADDEGTEHGGIHQKPLPLPAQHGNQAVDDPGVGKQIEHQARDNDPGQKVRHVQDGLHHALIGAVRDLIEHDGHENRNRVEEKDFVQADEQRVAQHHRELTRGKYPFEHRKADPGAGTESFENIELLEGHDQPAHGQVAEDQHKDHRSQQHQVQIPFHAQIAAQIRPFAC